MEKIERIGTTIERYIPDWLSGDTDSEMNVNVQGARAATSPASAGARGAVGAGLGPIRPGAPTNPVEGWEADSVTVAFNGLADGTRVQRESDDDAIDVHIEQRCGFRG